MFELPDTFGPMTIIATPSQIKDHFQKLRIQPGDLLIVKMSGETDVDQATVLRVIHALREIDVVQGARVVFLDPGLSLDHMTAAQLRKMGLISDYEEFLHYEKFILKEKLKEKQPGMEATK